MEAVRLPYLPRTIHLHLPNLTIAVIDAVCGVQIMAILGTLTGTTTMQGTECM